jgi:hypothetical protein
MRNGESELGVRPRGDCLTQLLQQIAGWELNILLVVQQEEQLAVRVCALVDIALFVEDAEVGIDGVEHVVEDGVRPAKLKQLVFGGGDEERLNACEIGYECLGNSELSKEQDV